MKNSLAVIATTLCLFFSSCYRPVAYFQPTPHPAATRIAVDKPAVVEKNVSRDTVAVEPQQLAIIAETMDSHVSIKQGPEQSINNRIEQRNYRIQRLLSDPAKTADKQPEPKKKLKLGNKIRQSLGMPLRKELNWWQRISWKLKASIIVILVAVLFAIFHVTILAVIFGLLGAFLLISGLKRSFKVRRPWF